MNMFPVGEPAAGDTAQPRILVIAAQIMPLAARISMALADAGFDVATLTPDGNPVRRLRRIRNHFTFRDHLTFGSRSSIKSAVRAIQRWSPDFLVCTDDLAVGELQVLHGRLSASRNRAHRHVSELIELSLGPAASFATARNKSDFLTRVESEGLRCPSTIVVPAARPFAAVPVELTYPTVVKADQSYGGICVRIADTDAAVRAAVWELQTPGAWRGIFRRLAGAILGSQALAPLMMPLRRTISLQQYVPGRPCNRAVVCWKGEFLAGISVEAVEVLKEHGPASVVRRIDHPEMARISGHMVRCLNLSGFIGFDFIVDSANQAWVIEMNPRVTPICHLVLADGTNLSASLFRRMNGLPQSPAPASASRDVVALFPGEVMRSPASEHIHSSRHDVPWAEPELVRSLLDQALLDGSSMPAGILAKSMRTFVERCLPQLAGRRSA